MNNIYHPKLTQRPEIENALKLINDKINGCGYSFKEDTAGSRPSIAFANSSEDDRSLIILASFDFSYYHNLEMVFYEVSYTNIHPGASWSDHWSKNQIEVSHLNFPEGYYFFINRGGYNEKQGIVRAKGFSYLFQNVGNSR